MISNRIDYTQYEYLQLTDSNFPSGAGILLDLLPNESYFDRVEFGASRFLPSNNYSTVLSLPSDRITFGDSTDSRILIIRPTDLTIYNTFNTVNYNPYNITCTLYYKNGKSETFNINIIINLYVHN